MSSERRIEGGEGRAIAGPKGITLFSVLLLSAFCSLFSAPVIAQGEDTTELAPPPLKILSRQERSQLEAEDNLKDRTKLALSLMNLRLGTAEKLYVNGDYEGTYRELGGFHALMDESLDFLHDRDSRSGKVLDNFKRVEIALRGFAPRLEGIRREMPLRYEDYVRKLIKYVREARTKATEPLFADTVVPTRKQDQ